VNPVKKAMPKEPSNLVVLSPAMIYNLLIIVYVEKSVFVNVSVPSPHTDMFSSFKGEKLSSPTTWPCLLPQVETLPHPLGDHVYFFN